MKFKEFLFKKPKDAEFADQLAGMTGRAMEFYSYWLLGLVFLDLVFGETDPLLIGMGSVLLVLSLSFQKSKYKNKLIGIMLLITMLIFTGICVYLTFFVNFAESGVILNSFFLYISIRLVQSLYKI